MGMQIIGVISTVVHFSLGVDASPVASPASSESTPPGALLLQTDDQFTALKEDAPAHRRASVRGKSDLNKRNQQEIASEGKMGLLLTAGLGLINLFSSYEGESEKKPQHSLEKSKRSTPKKSKSKSKSKSKISKFKNSKSKKSKFKKVRYTHEDGFDALNNDDTHKDGLDALNNDDDTHKDGFDALNNDDDTHKDGFDTLEDDDDTHKDAGLVNDA
ncbi:hypothetical protein DSO57_1030722 [Entomophthora muscae]|uniref:Uncharacterized protein n=1 Tax=Entomophthora muscae TaxID=34485 RepID=A0ACC2UMI7_9FUNG|nr:hypothetical protein DSO57_1030722 [Entomophthora muscae]